MSNASHDEPASQGAGTDFPPANFLLLVTLLATQALTALGESPAGDGVEAKVDKVLAKHFIDLLGVLEEKTQGNLEDHEKQMLAGMLHSLRMTFVNK